MIKDSLYFVYDNINSRDMGLININYSITGGLVEEPFLANREVLEINTYNKEKPFFQDIKTYPLMINLEFAFENGFSSERLQEVKRWFSVSYFKELYFSSEPNKRYYAVLVDDSFLLHNSMGEGLVTATFRCNASWAFSPTYETEIYDFSVNPFQKSID